MPFFQVVRGLALCSVLLISLPVARLMSPAQASPVPATSACNPPSTLPVPGAPQVLALDSHLHVLIVGTSQGLVLLNSCSGTPLRPVVPAGGIPLQVAVDEGAGTALVLVSGLTGAELIRIFDIKQSRWVRPNVQLQSGAVPTALMVPSGTHLGLILDPADFTLWAVDTRSGKVRHKITNLPHGLTAAIGMDVKRHRAFVGSTGPNQVTVIDTTTWTLVKKTLLAGPSGWPWALAVSVATGRVFVATQDNSGRHAKALSVLDTSSGALVNSVSLQFAPQALAVDEQRELLYVATQGTGGHQGPMLVLDAHNGEPIPSHGRAACSLVVDPNNGNVYYLCPGGPVGVSPPPGPPHGPGPIHRPHPIQPVFYTNFSRGWDAQWQTTKQPPDGNCITAHNPPNQYVLNIVYSGSCADNMALIERWAPFSYVNGAISATFTLRGSAFVGLAARIGNDSGYQLVDAIVAPKSDYICLTEFVSAQYKILRCGTPPPVAQAAPKVLELQAHGNVLAASFNNAQLFSYTDAKPLLAAGLWAFYAQGIHVAGQHPGQVRFLHLALYQQ
jgi:hypothetical protein